MESQVDYSSSSSTQHTPQSGEFWSPGETISAPTTSYSCNLQTPPSSIPRGYNILAGTPTGPLIPGNTEISSLRQVVESQQKLESMVEKLLERISNLEESSLCLAASSNKCSRSELKKERLPTELSVCFIVYIIKQLTFVMK